MYEVYQFKDGDNINDIAILFGTTRDDIYKLNGFSESMVVVPGMMLVVPKRKNANYLYYTVKKGDSVYEIAKDYGVDYKILLALNGLDEGDYIYPNQTLIVPNEGMGVYMTSDNDTIRGVMDYSGLKLEELMKDNEKIYLMPEQVIMFHKK